MSICQFRIDDKVHDRFKKYCAGRDTTMSKVLLDCIDILVPENKYRYCDCGIDLFTLSPQDRLLHVQNCKNGQNS
jgi:hypothetical protein